MLQVTFECAANHVQRLEEQLLSVNTVSITRRDAVTNRQEPHVEADWENQSIEIILPLNSDLKWVSALVESIGGRNLNVSFLNQDAWKSHPRDPQPAIQIGRYLIGPEHEIRDNPNGITISSTLAFGTGYHPTTRLCLRWLSELDITNSKVLDVGCGSGLLSIAAAKSNAIQVTSVDIDPDALKTTDNNAQANGVNLRLLTRIPSKEIYDVAVANIVTDTLIRLAKPISASLKPDGILALCGITLSQRSDIRSQFDAITFGQEYEDEGWVLMSGRRHT